MPAPAVPVRDPLLTLLADAGVLTRSTTAHRFQDRHGHSWASFTLLSPGDLQTLLNLVACWVAAGDVGPDVADRANGSHAGGLGAWTHEFATATLRHPKLTVRIAMPDADALRLAAILTQKRSV